jgi:hypothetical protein
MFETFRCLICLKEVQTIQLQFELSGSAIKWSIIFKMINQLQLIKRAILIDRRSNSYFALFLNLEPFEI